MMDRKVDEDLRGNKRKKGNEKAKKNAI